MNNYSFRNAYESLPANKQSEVRQKIMDTFGWRLTSFYRRMKGNPEPRMSEAFTIETIFADYGITDVWNNY
jgi:hypothetical protein